MDMEEHDAYWAHANRYNTCEPKNRKTRSDLKDEIEKLERKLIGLKERENKWIIKHDKLVDINRKFALANKKQKMLILLQQEFVEKIIEKQWTMKPMGEM